MKDTSAIRICAKILANRASQEKNTIHFSLCYSGTESRWYVEPYFDAAKVVGC